MRRIVIIFSFQVVLVNLFLLNWWGNIYYLFKFRFCNIKCFLLNKVMTYFSTFLSSKQNQFKHTKKDQHINFEKWSIGFLITYMLLKTTLTKAQTRFELVIFGLRDRRHTTWPLRLGVSLKNSFFSIVDNVVKFRYCLYLISILIKQNVILPIKFKIIRSKTMA